MLANQIKSLADRYLDHCSTLDSRYKLLHKLGEGRYGKVYLALDLKSGDLVAVKLLRGTGFRYQLTNFFNEIRHLVFLLDCLNCEKSLKATKIVDFSFEGRLNGCKPVAYYIMEFVELGEFYGLIERADYISEELAGYFTKQLAANLKLLHSYKLYHLDIKPENVLVNEKGELYFCDFGNAVCCKKPKEVHWKKVGFVGSFEYAAPEAYELDLIKEMKGVYQHIKEYELGKLDVFSLGVLVFVLVVKSQPFGRAQDDDPYFKRFLVSKESFWGIFEKLRPASKDFKSLVETMLEPVNSERVELKHLEAQDWLVNEQNKHDIEIELKTLLSKRKQVFMKEFAASLESNLTKRKQVTSHGKMHRYKDGEDVLRQFLVKNEKKILRLKYEITECQKSLGRFSPSEISSVSGNSSDDDF